MYICYKKRRIITYESRGVWDTLQTSGTRSQSCRDECSTLMWFISSLDFFDIPLLEFILSSYYNGYNLRWLTKALETNGEKQHELERGHLLVECLPNSDLCRELQVQCVFHMTHVPHRPESEKKKAQNSLIRTFFSFSLDMLILVEFHIQFLKQRCKNLTPFIWEMFADIL